MTTAATREQVHARPASPAELVGETAATLSSIPREGWDGVDSEASAALSHGFLTAWENAELSGLSSRPVTARDPVSGAVVAACPGYFYDLDLVGVPFPSATAALGWVRRMFPRLLFTRTYELGSPTPLTRPFLIEREELRPVAVKALIEAAVREGDRAGARFLLVQNFTACVGPAAEQLRRLGFLSVGIPPTAVVDLPYASFDDYLGAMRAQYRRRARQALKRSHALRVEHHEQFEDLADDLARLWRLIYDRAREIKRELLTPAYFQAVSRLAQSSVLVLRREDGSVASFALLLADGPWLSFLQCGFDAEAGRSEGAYFRLLYEIVRFGIETGFRQVDLGITTLEPKLDVGGIPVPLFAWVRHRNPVIQRVLQTVADRVMNPASVAPRHVFKEPPAGAAELVARRGLPT